MTRVDVYCSALDRQVIVNSEWTTDYRYVKIGNKVYNDSGCLIIEVNMLNEKDTDTWKLKPQVSRWFKFKFRIRLLMQIWKQTK